MTKNSQLYKAFGQAVRQYRAKAKLNQEELAHRAGLHRTYIGSVERGERNVSLKNIHALAAALGVTASRLLIVAELIQGKGSRSRERP